MLVALKNGEARVAIDGKKFLSLLGMTEEDCEKEGADREIALKLFNMSDDERKKLFSEALLENIIERSESENTVNTFSIYPCKTEFSDRDPKIIKKDIKKCKNYMQKKILEKELQYAYKRKRSRHYA